MILLALMPFWLILIGVIVLVYSARPKLDHDELERFVVKYRVHYPTGVVEFSQIGILRRVLILILGYKVERIRK